MSATQADWEKARARFIDAFVPADAPPPRAASKPIAPAAAPETPRAAEQPAGVEQLGLEVQHRCPVGCCHPHTGATFEVDDAGHFCVRHYAKLSQPMRYSLALARSEGGEKLKRMLAEAIVEVRNNDPEWSRWLVSVGGRVERYEHWQTAVLRFHALDDDELQPVLISGTTGVQVSRDQIREQSPHRVVAEDGSRLAESRTLAEAIDNAEQRRGGGTWPGGHPPIVVGSWSCEDLTWSEALAIVGRKPAKGDGR